MLENTLLTLNNQLIGWYFFGASWSPSLRRNIADVLHQDAESCSVWMSREIDELIDGGLLLLLRLVLWLRLLMHSWVWLECMKEILSLNSPGLSFVFLTFYTLALFIFKDLYISFSVLASSLTISFSLCFSVTFHTEIQFDNTRSHSVVASCIHFVNDQTLNSVALAQYYVSLLYVAGMCVMLGNFLPSWFWWNVFIIVHIVLLYKVE